jgi:hypothetical protein
MNGVGVHLHLIEAVFQRVGDAHGGMWQLAPLADRHKAGRDLMRHRAAENEAARLDAGDLVDLVTRPWMHQFIDRTAEPLSVNNYVLANCAKKTCSINTQLRAGN